MKNKKTELELEEEKRKKYGCNGMCYGGVGEHGEKIQICGGIDTCEETRKIEGIIIILVAFGALLLIGTEITWTISRIVSL